MTRYQIQGRDENRTSGWSTYVLGPKNVDADFEYDTHEAAEAAIEELRKIGEEWDHDGYRVTEITE